MSEPVKTDVKHPTYIINYIHVKVEQEVLDAMVKSAKLYEHANEWGVDRNKDMIITKLDVRYGKTHFYFTTEDMPVELEG